MARRATTGGKAGKARRRNTKSRQKGHPGSASTLQKQLRHELADSRKQLAEALEQQTATADVLKIISSSPDNLEAVFNAMLENATRLCGAKFGTLNFYDGEKFKTAALYNPRLVQQSENNR